MHKTIVDVDASAVHTSKVAVQKIHKITQDVCGIPDVRGEFLTPDEVARILPNTSAKNVRDWCAATPTKMPGAIQLPSGRWQIPWSTVIGILGFDPRSGSPTTVSPASPQSPPVAQG